MGGILRSPGSWDSVNGRPKCSSAIIRASWLPGFLPLSFLVSRSLLELELRFQPPEMTGERAESVKASSISTSDFSELECAVFDVLFSNRLPVCRANVYVASCSYVFHNIRVVGVGFLEVPMFGFHSPEVFFGTFCFLHDIFADKIWLMCGLGDIGNRGKRIFCGIHRYGCEHVVRSNKYIYTLEPGGTMKKMLPPEKQFVVAFSKFNTNPHRF